MYVISCQSTLEGLAISDSKVPDVVGNNRQSQIQHLERAVALLSEHNCLALHVGFDGPKRFFA